MAAPMVPSWLLERFPGREWKSFRLCALRVDESLGAGLQMEETDLGYQVDEVALEPGQDPALRQGDVIFAIDGVPLLGLEHTAVGDLFGAHFRDGVEVSLLRAEELREAVIERDANEECPCELPAADGDEIDEPPETSGNYELLRRAKSSTDYHARVRIPVGRAVVWKLDPETFASIKTDLRCLSDKFGLSACAQVTEAGDMQSVVLEGSSDAIASARGEVVEILQFYREKQQQRAASSCADATDEAALAAARDAATGADAAGASATALAVPGHVRDLDLRQFEFMDHTADIIVHSWGTTRAEAFAQVCVGMFQYMTPLERIQMNRAVEVEASGHDLLDLLYHLLDEFLFIFGTEMHVSRCVEVIEFDEANLKIVARGYGEAMDLSKHEQGTEIKAITMHMMKILSPDVVISEAGTVARKDACIPERVDFPHEAYVLLDI